MVKPQGCADSKLRKLGSGKKVFVAKLGKRLGKKVRGGGR